jgi:hypothetical protein
MDKKDLRKVCISGHQLYYEGWFHKFTNDGRIITEDDEGKVSYSTIAGLNIEFKEHIKDKELLKQWKH